MNKLQKTSKKYLPKYSAGGTKTRTLANGNEVSDAQSSATEGTQNIYNDKRSSKLNIGQYANYATAAVNLGVGLSNNQNLSGAAKDQANANTINGTVDAVAGSATPWYGYAKTASGIGKSMTSPTSVTDPTTGKTVTQSSNKTNQAFSDTFTPMHETAINDFSSGNAGRGVLDVFTGGVWNTMDNYINGTNQKEFDKAKANEATYNQQQTDLANQQNAAAQQQQESYINGMVNKGISDYASQNKGSYIQYPNGGMNMQPNAEVEKQENSIAPDGEFTQFNGPSHEQGGIPVNLERGELIFSDKLKFGNKTFAQLNKVNNTNKQDKVLDNPNADKISKKTAELLRMAKLKNSENLFQQQEDLKQSKIDNYIKRMGGTQKYPLGGAYSPNQYKQAQADSMTLYKSGLNPRMENYQYPGYNDAYLRLNDINRQPPSSTNNTVTFQGKEYTGATSQFQKPTMIPYNQQITNPVLPNVTNVAPVQNKPVYHPEYTQSIDGIPKSNTFENGGKMLPKFYTGGESEDDQLGYVPNNQIDKMRMQQAMNGKPVYTPNIQESSYNPNVLPWDRKNDSGQGPNGKSEQYNNSNNYIVNKEVPETQTDSNNFDWGKLGTQVGLGIANNAGSIYDLVRSNKPEVTKFQRANASLLDPTAALRDATDQTRRAEYNVRNASSGNAGTYLSNRVGLTAQNIVNKDRIRQEYANANAGILNQNSQFNTGIANQEYVANEQNRAQTRNIKGQALANIGSNVVSQYRDNKAQQYDQTTLDNMSEFYNALKNDPYAKARWEKIKKGYK